MIRMRGSARGRAGVLILGLVAIGSGVLGACDAGTTAPQFLQLLLNPPSATLEVGETVQFHARQRKTDGSTSDVSAVYSADRGSITPSGLYTATDPGTATVTARTAAGQSVSASLMVNQPAPVLEQVVLSPDTSRLEPGQSAQFQASGIYDDGVSRAVTVTYQATGGTIDGSGRYTAGSAGGTYRVIATAATGPADTAAVIINQGTGGGAVLESIEVSPAEVTLVAGAQRQYTVEGTFSDGSTVDVTGQTTFNATGGTITSPGGLYQAGEVAGTFSVTARIGNLESAASVTIVPRVLIAIGIAPQAVTVKAGSSQLFSVTGIFNDGSSSLVGATFVATGGTITAGGLYTAGSTAGTFRVVATAGTHVDTATVTVTAQGSGVTLQSIALSPASASLAPGATRQFGVVGTYSDGSTANLTGSASYTATGGTVSQAALYTAGTTPGSYRLVATVGAAADTAAITITAPSATLQSVALTPAAATLPVGGGQQFTVTGSYSDGTTSNLTGSATWTATGGTITAGGLYTAGSTAGTFRVIASSAGHADTAAVTVTAAPAPTLQSISLTPATVALLAGGSRQFAVSGSYSDGTTQTLTSSATYTATGGTITAGGRYTAGSSAGSYRVIATHSGKADTSTVTITVTAPTLQSISLTPSSISLNTGASQQFAVTGSWSDGSSTNLTSSATYTATGGSISAAGLYTAGGTAGSFRVIATSGVRADTANVTLTSSAPSALATECAAPDAAWIFCDDFSINRLGSYFEVDNAGGTFDRITGVGVDGSAGMRATFTQGTANAGNLKLAFGRTPTSYMAPADAGAVNYRDVYWRMYLRNQPGWTGGGGDKLFRAIVFAGSNWAEAAIGHVWAGGSGNNYLVVDPASGTDTQGNLQTTQYNDFANLRWLGAATGTLPLFNSTNVGTWRCVEAHMSLNDAGLSNGVLEYWIDGSLQARKTGLNFLGSYSAYGINAVFFENYWNNSSPQPQSRYFDNIVVSTERVGCSGASGSGGTPVAAVDLNASSSTVAAGATLQMTATPRSKSGATVSASVSWASSNPSILTVNGSGLVTGVAAGSATVLATSGGKTGSRIVQVTAGGGGGGGGGSTPVVATVSLSPASSTITVGATQQFTATAREADGTAIPGKTFTWSSSNGGVASVSSSGVATGVVPGSSTITATVDGKSGTATVTVNPAVQTVASVSVSPSSASITVGGTRQYTATPRDGSGNAIAGKTVTWSSSSTSVATVSGAGLATGVAAGTANIRATVDGVTGQAPLTVTGGGGGGGGSSSANFVEDFSTYSSTANMLADPRGIYSESFDAFNNSSIGGANKGGAGTVELDQTDGYGGLSQSLKYTWFSYGSAGPGGQIRRMLEWPSGQTEIWSEIAFKFSSNFKTDYGYSGGAAYKWLFWVGPATGHGWNLGLLGSSGVVSQEYEDMSGGTSDKPSPYSNNFGLSNLADGQWHVLRVHIRRNSPYFDVRIDGTQNRAPLTSWSSSATVWGLILGQNMNMRPVNNVQTLHYGYIKVWYGGNDPGWGW